MSAGPPLATKASLTLALTTCLALAALTPTGPVLPLVRVRLGELMALGTVGSHGRLSRWADASLHNIHAVGRQFEVRWVAAESVSAQVVEHAARRLRDGAMRQHPCKTVSGL